MLALQKHHTQCSGSRRRHIPCSQGGKMLYIDMGDLNSVKKEKKKTVRN